MWIPINAPYIHVPKWRFLNKWKKFLNVDCMSLHSSSYVTLPTSVEKIPKSALFWSPHILKNEQKMSHCYMYFYAFFAHCGSRKVWSWCLILTRECITFLNENVGLLFFVLSKKHHRKCWALQHSERLLPYPIGWSVTCFFTPSLHIVGVERCDRDAWFLRGNASLS